MPAPLPETAPSAALPRGLFRRFLGDYLRPEAGRISATAALLILEGATLGALSWLIKPLFDRVFASGGTAFLLPVGLGIFGLFLLRALATLGARTLSAIVTQNVTAALQRDLLAHLLRLEHRFFKENPPGALIEKVQGDTLAVQGLWSTLLTSLGRDGVALIALFTVTLMIDWRWTLAALIGAPLLLLPALGLQRYIQRKTRLMREKAGERATRLDEIFHGMEAVRLHQMEAYQTRRFAAVLAQIRRAEVRMSAGRAMMPALIDIVTGLGFFAVLVLGGPEVAAGTRSIGDFMAFFTALALSFQPLRRLGDLAGSWQIAGASLQRLYALFDLPVAAAPPAPPGAPALPQPPGLQFHSVHFAYEGRPVLRGLSFTATPGEITALVGPSGAGKSTVFQLLAGLETPQKGRILLGGQDIAQMPRATLRAALGVVTQELGIFDETLRENLTLGRDIPETALQAALTAAQAAAFVDAAPLGLETPAGPRGAALSGGQRQRLAIARALLRDAPVLLLDEATSALDAEAESALAKSLRKIAKGRTVLLIAHRLSTVRQADQIVVLDQGRAVEAGTHAALLAQGGRYAALFAAQNHR